MKTCIFLLTIIFTLGLVSCSSDDPVNPEPPTFIHPLDGKWTWVKKETGGWGGHDGPDYFDPGDLIFEFHVENPEGGMVDIQVNLENADQYPIFGKVFPFYESGEFEFTIANDSIQFKLDYWPTQWYGPYFKDSYLIRNDSLFIGDNWSGPVDEAGSKRTFIRLQ